MSFDPDHSPARWERLDAHLGNVGGLTIRRALPTAKRRMVGAWCFLDHAGPADLTPQTAMRVGPHPHTGLQTFSWMIEGEILHRDSLGTEQMLRPGQVNLMTAGRGISHSEESRSDRLQLAQLWIALPDDRRHGPPAFEHFPSLPALRVGEFDATLLVGDFDGQRSPVPSHTPLLGMDLSATSAAQATLLLEPGFEYGLMVLEGSLSVAVNEESTGLSEPGQLLYVAPGAQSLQLMSGGGKSRALLLGGPPFPENVLLWWNFVGRSRAEMDGYAAEWNGREDGGVFGQVRGYEGPRLMAPVVPPLKTPG
ncbi:pirin family protein [Roseateles amylovorans]|uniref:Pirin family protein n=1 Tax=Roseateles amylovorans TaxID=2978473 RepID=A0ABY6AXE9_9BURK|nr:pirin family protein [Roseateles amylovorans]UXH77846.1 pirin family protein [Roseateles amylovorans]